MPWPTTLGGHEARTRPSLPPPATGVDAIAVVDDLFRQLDIDDLGRDGPASTSAVVGDAQRLVEERGPTHRRWLERRAQAGISAAAPHPPLSPGRSASRSVAGVPWMRLLRAAERARCGRRPDPGRRGRRLQRDSGPPEAASLRSSFGLPHPPSSPSRSPARPPPPAIPFGDLGGHRGRDSHPHHHPCREVENAERRRSAQHLSTHGPKAVPSRPILVDHLGRLAARAIDLADEAVMAACLS